MSFEWGSDGGQAALRFGSPCTEEGAASGDARHGNRQVAAARA
jgi:hypothetical protein